MGRTDKTREHGKKELGRENTGSPIERLGRLTVTLVASPGIVHLAIIEPKESHAILPQVQSRHLRLEGRFYPISSEREEVLVYGSSPPTSGHRQTDGDTKRAGTKRKWDKACSFVCCQF